MMINILLMVSNMFYVPFHIWDVILPIDFHSIIFQDGYCTTNQMIDDKKMGKITIHELGTPLNQYEGMTWADFDC